MALKTTVFFEVEKNKNEYRFYIPPNAPIGEVYDAAFSILMDITKLANESAEKAKRTVPDASVTDKDGSDKSVPDKEVVSKEEVTSKE